MIFRPYACDLRNPAVQQAAVEIRDTEFPGPPLDFWPRAARDREVSPSTALLGLGIPTDLKNVDRLYLPPANKYPERGLMRSADL